MPVVIGGGPPSLEELLGDDAFAIEPEAFEPPVVHPALLRRIRPEHSADGTRERALPRRYALCDERLPRGVGPQTGTRVH